MHKNSADGFLGHALTIQQPPDGHRSGTDAVLLAASIEETGGQNCLELGCGVGVATLCLAHRLTAARVTGIDADAALIAMATDNARANQLEKRVDFIGQDIHADFDSWPLPPAQFAQVFANPPFYAPAQSTPPPNESKHRAHIARADTLEIWVKRAATLLTAGGRLTLIHRPQALPAILAAMQSRFGGIRLKALHPTATRSASRILISAQRDSRAPLTCHPPLALHDSQGGYLPAVEDILRHGAGLDWGG